MKIQVSQLADGQSTFHWVSDTDSGLKEFYKARRAQGYDLVGPIQLDLDVTKLEPDYYLRGRLRFALNLACAHCGESVASDIAGPFELSLVRTDRVKAGTERIAEEADDLDLICFTGNELELDPLLEEQFLLNVPQQVECGTAACLERARSLMQKVHDQVDHWKDKSNPFSVLGSLKKPK